MGYRLSLFGQDGRMLVEESFWAPNDIGAEEAAWVVIEACNDIAEAYEVRHKGVLLARGRRKCGLFNLKIVINRQQTNILDLLSRLQIDFTPIGHSRRLVDINNKLRRRGFL